MTPPNNIHRTNGIIEKVLVNFIFKTKQISKADFFSKPMFRKSNTAY